MRVTDLVGRYSRVSRLHVGLTFEVCSCEFRVGQAVWLPVFPAVVTAGVRGKCPGGLESCPGSIKAGREQKQGSRKNSRSWLPAAARKNRRQVTSSQKRQGVGIPAAWDSLVGAPADLESRRCPHRPRGILSGHDPVADKGWVGAAEGAEEGKRPSLHLISCCGNDIS